MSGSLPHEVAIAALLAVSALCSLGDSAQAEPLDFQRDVQPILADHCFHCHGQDEKHREGGLRLDVRDAAMARLESSATALVPGKPEASEIFRRISSQDPEEVMPPPSIKKPLNPRQIETLQRWIAQGGSLLRALGISRAHEIGRANGAQGA